jgi:hypothetical protein
MQFAGMGRMMWPRGGGGAVPDDAIVIDNATSPSVDGEAIVLDNATADEGAFIIVDNAT